MHLYSKINKFISRNKILFRVKEVCATHLCVLKAKKVRFSNDLKDKSKVIVLGTPTHDNLGDQAIAYAQEKFLKSNMEDYHYIEISENDVFGSYRSLKKILNESDMIFILGGGNLGTLYPKEERARRFIVSKFTKNKIISFPQSVYFEKSLEGELQLELSKEVYNRNSNFILTAREHNTLKKLRKEFKNTILYSPDIVLSCKYEDGSKRNGVMTVLRDDIEKKISDSFTEELTEAIKKECGFISNTDTTFGGTKIIDKDNRNNELLKIFQQFSAAEVVVTDRLHGMIFSYITNTPCIALNNDNKKVQYTFESWLKESNYIKFIDEENICVDNILLEIENLKKITPKYVSLEGHFSEFLNIIKK